MDTTLLIPEKTTSLQRVLFVICLLCYFFGGLVSTLMSVYLPVVVRELVGNVNEAELGRVGAYISSTFLCGWMLGGMGFGLAGDRLGRIRTFVGAVALYAVFTILTGYSSSWLMVIACRFLSGMGVGGVLVLATILVSEAWPPKRRSVAIGILAVAFPVGIIAAGAINNLIIQWRLAFWVGSIPLLIALFSVGILKESAQWSLAKKRPTQPSDNQLPLLFQPAHRYNLLMGAFIFGAVLVGLWAVFSWLPTWVQSLFNDPALGQKERGTTMMLLGSGGIIGGCFSGFLSNRLGYRKTLLLTFGGSFLMCVLLFTTNSVFSPVIYAETAGLALFFGISQGALSAYLPELFPVSIRATATGFCFNIGRLATAIAVFFVGALVSALGGYGNAVLIFSVTFLLGFVVLYYSKTLEARPESSSATS